jgi:ABC-type multidrug transport system fused ATPase/permease subunit
VLALLFREDWRLGLLFTLLSAVGLGASFWVRRITSRYAAAQRQAVADLEGFVEERLYALPDVRANAMQPHLLDRLGLALRETYQRARAMVVAGNTLGWVTGTTGLLTSVLTLGAGAALFTRGEVTLGTVYLLFQYQALLRRPLGEMTRQLQDFQRAGASVERVQRLVDTRSTVPDGPGAALPPGPLAVEFDTVDFAYDADAGSPQVLHGVSFAVRPGEVLGLLGRTGSGKTTLTRLLLRQYDPSAGRVLLGGVDLRALRREGLRREVAMVTQEVQLFRATVRENLTLFDQGVPEGSVLGALERLGLRPWLERLPRGLDTPLGPDGEGLSAGEAQLLACGRVFLRDPRVVVLDEASSRLDPATERLIRGAIDRLLEGRTGIVVAHRLETVQRADAVLVLEGGRVAEWGPRAVLGADSRSRYAALLRGTTAATEVLA